MGVLVAYTVCAMVWGTTWLAIRICIGEHGFPTIPSAALRFSIAAAILLPIIAFGFGRPGPRNRAQWLWLVFSGVLNAVGYSLVYLGEERIAGGLAAVLFGTEPFAIALMITITRIERVTRADLAGAVVALVGVGVIFSNRLDVAPQQAVGVVLVLAAVFVSGIYAVIVKRHAGDIDPLYIAAVFLTTTAVTLWLFVVVRGWQPLPWPPPVAPSLALLYLAIFGSVVAFVTYFYLLRRVSLMTSSTLVFVLPVIALVADSQWEDDVSLDGRSYLGIGLTLAGVLLGALLKPRSRATHGVAVAASESK